MVTQADVDGTNPAKVAPRAKSRRCRCARRQPRAERAVLSADRSKLFTEPNYNGFPAVLVRLDAITTHDLAVLLEETWRCQASAALVKRAKGGA